MMIDLKPKYSKFIRVIVLDDGFILLEAYSEKFKNHAFLYKLDKNLNFVWELRDPPHEGFHNLVVKGSTLKVHLASGEGDLNTSTGEITNLILTR